VATDLRDEALEELRPVILFGRLAGLIFWCCHGDRLLRVEKILHQVGVRRGPAS
jgi:hypothetical protein